jgi:hypothetical protein
LVVGLSEGVKVSLKEYLATIGNVADKSWNAAKEKTVGAAKITADKSRELTAKAKDSLEQRRNRPKKKFDNLEIVHGIISSDIIVPPIEEMAISEGKVLVSVEEYERMNLAVEQLQLEQERTSELLLQIVSLEAVSSEVQVEQTNKGWSLISKSGERRDLKTDVEPIKLTSEVSKSLQETMMLLGVTVLWLTGLTGLNYFISTPLLPDATLQIITWSIGTGAWSLFVLWRLKKARTFLGMPSGMRIQTAIGIGLVTAMSIILMKEQQIALQNVWGWTAAIALSTLLLSGLLRGIWNGLSRLFTRKK